MLSIQQSWVVLTGSLMKIQSSRPLEDLQSALSPSRAFWSSFSCSLLSGSAELLQRSWWWCRWCRLWWCPFLWDLLPFLIFSDPSAALSLGDSSKERLLWRLWLESDGASSSLDLRRFLCLDLTLPSESESSSDDWGRCLWRLELSFLVDLRSSSSLL